jgi:hypothetical protein
MNNLIAYKTIVKKEFLRFVRIWVQTIFPPIITTSLYLLIFGGLMGERIGDMDGVAYIQFIIPGSSDNVCYYQFLLQHSVFVFPWQNLTTALKN